MAQMWLLAAGLLRLAVYSWIKVEEMRFPETCLPAKAFRDGGKPDRD